MRVELISTRELGPAERYDWRRLQGRERAMGAPALSPDWAACVGDARPDARIAVIQDGAGRVHGLMPVQIASEDVIEPLGASLDLGCAVIGDPDLEWGAADWLADMRARSLPFSGAPERQIELARAARGYVPRAAADLLGGPDLYLARRREDGVDVMRRRARRAAALTAWADAPPRVRRWAWDRADFEQILAWSRAPLADQRSGSPVWRRWEAAALSAAFERDADSGFHGALFTVHLGDALVAGVLLLVDGRQAQLVFHGEDPLLRRLEPAAYLMVETIAALGASGVAEIDLGLPDGPIARELATRRRHRLYGLVRPTERRRPIAPRLFGGGRKGPRGAG